MLIFGHPLINMQKFSHYENIFIKTNVNCFEYDESVIKNAKDKKVDFGIFVKNEEEILLSNALGAKYILIKDENLAKIASKMAEFYMFDSKILFLLDTLKNNLKKAYELNVDGVCLKSFIG
ncbi:hypothetical protein ACYQB5_001255, partial [Campylobacter lari]|uniref:hypothetical protein n=1 Tax=Campylobacter lari TaxID=201 RepID=UPI0012849767|nr:hypothetical protein [Campylobacter lari]EAI4429700.1 hypothetical protein [Campylobacter lari]EAI5530247.1 hypothetical protein [Campylobacter lari]EAJ0340689.1 hypothetical protein [Campylobacter lari]EAK9938922.1 hypothetical protein [Campylobacter lari]EGK1191232.1 hypothetical protein [Campylobacter lari]